jgi:hypothetical protein
MSGLFPVCRCVLVLRAVATADVSACKALPKRYPRVSCLDAVFTDGYISWCKILDLPDVCTYSLFHAIKYSNNPVRHEHRLRLFIVYEPR